MKTINEDTEQNQITGEKQGIETLLETINTKLQNAIDKAIAAAPRVVIYVDEIKLGMRVSRIEKDLAIGNQILNDYCALLVGFKKDVSILQQLATLPINPESIATHLKITWLDHNKINLGIAFKREALAQAYDFKPEDENLIQSIYKLLFMLESSKRILSLCEYWNMNEHCFLFTQSNKASMREALTTYASSDDLRAIISAELLLMAATTMEDAGCRLSVNTFKELLGQMIDVKSNGIMYVSKIAEYKIDMIKQDGIIRKGA